MTKFDRDTGVGSTTSAMRGWLQMFVVICTVAGSMLVASTASAERYIRSLPYTENFNTNNYSDLLWLTQGGTHTWMPTAGWQGSGAAKFTAPLAEGYTGLGQFLLSSLPSIPEQLNLRFLIYYGSTWQEYGPGGKLVIMNRSGNRGRPMVIIRDWTDSGGTWETWGACDGTTCKYNNSAEPWWPDGSERLRIGNGHREREWISLELEANTRTGIIKLYVDTQDGAMSGLYIEQPMVASGPGGVWSHIDIIGGYMNWGSIRQDPENYFMIDEVAIGSQRIGPPVGFTSTSGTRPNPPTSVTVQ
jgi:hypothetical protein